MSSILGEGKHKDWDVPLEDKLYDPDNEAKEFYKKETRIDDDAELKQHIIRVQQKAFSIFQYPCIRVFEFMRLKLARLPAYGQLLELGKTRDGAIFVDLGCCFGNDCRKAIQDGYPIQNVVASDLRKGLWSLGHELFRSTPETFPVPFVEGDVFNSSSLEIQAPFTSPPGTPRPNLKSLTSLNPLRGHVSAVFAGAFFHLFPEEGQEHVARALAGLLSPEPGSMLIGVHGGMAEKGTRSPEGSTYKMFCHSPQSWKELWEGILGKNIEVKAQLREEVGGPTFFGTFPKSTKPYIVMEWSVVRK